ncbi:DUF2336 domain-containing protein [uncultured Cohaesibacter sp.]|uniref:DUF2336 domain-containing protein n=1 Tax=uncultured Cohaesibacter sp. TaxID=1002546 RepID=UPI002AAA8174|nr:DUF2336 domain-containing protein [uncultured Cohaesibacter sp.]
MKSLIARSRLAEETETYLIAGQFDRLAQAQFTHIFRRHFGATPIADRVAISQKLCSMRRVSRDVVLLLCCDVDTVAAPVLAHSPLLGATDLTIQVLQGNCTKRKAIAQRADLTPLLISQLLLFEEPSVARHLAENRAARPSISAPMQAKIERIGALKFEQLEPKAMSQETDKLDALVSSMEQDWCAHYKPDSLFEDHSANASSAVPPTASEDTRPETSQASASQPALARATSTKNDEALLLDAEDMKLLDQLSESDWDALDDDAIEALARQLAETDQSQLDDALPLSASSDTVYGVAAALEQEAPVVSASEKTPTALAPSNEQATEDTPPVLDLSDMDLSSMDISEPEELMDDVEMLEAAATAQPSEFEEETGPASFTIGVFDSENADFPLLKSPLLGDEREATIFFGPADKPEEDAPAMSTSYVAPDDDVDFNACDKTSFVISAEEPPLAELLPPMQEEAPQEEPSAPLTTKVPLASFSTSPMDNLRSALKRPLDKQEAELLAQASQKLANRTAGEPLSKEPVASRSLERKPQITLTIRKSSNSETVSTPNAGEAEKATKAPTAAPVSELADSSAPSDTAQNDLSIPRAHLTSATEDDWERALARLTGDLPASEEDGVAPRIFSVPASESTNQQTETKTNPLAQMSTTGLEKVVEAIESELSLDSIATTGQSEISSQDEEPVGSAEEDAVEGHASSEDISIISEATDQPLIAEPLPIPHGAPLSANDDDTTDEPLIHEHAPLGFMPDMISFAGLELVEAEPDLPSVSDLLLETSSRAMPHVELVEPIEIDILENGEITALEDLEATPMQVISEQLEAQREALNALRQKMKDYEDGTRQSVSAASFSVGFQADHDAPAPIENMDTESEAHDISSLPELSQHTLVDVEAYEAIKGSEKNQSTNETAASSSSSSDESNETDPVDLASMVLNATARDGMANSFYGYDAETRLTILQSILAETIVDAGQQSKDDQARAMLDDFTVQELVAARFSNDRIRAADLMHDISGHRRLDMTQLLQDKGGEALVVYLYSIGLDESSTLSILLHGPDAIAHNYEKITQLMTLYHQLYPAAANKIVAQLFGQPRTVASMQHAPLHDEGAGKNAARLRTTGLQSFSDASRKTASEASALPEFGRRLKRPEQG